MKEEVLSADYLKHIILDFRQMKDFITNPLVFSEANGVWYKDINGKSYLDGMSAVLVVNIGHNNPRVKEAIKEQLERMTFTPPLVGTSPAAIKLAKKIADISPPTINSVKLLSGGSEAIEAAMKLARQYHKQTGNPNKYKVISRYHAYHGGTMGALSATGCIERKWMFEPTLQGYIHVMPPLCYRCPYGKQYPDCNVLCATIIEDIVKLEGPGTIASLIAEPIGNVGGIIPPPPQYFSILRDICNQYDILMILDEVITGFGRTGQMFGAQTYKVQPDIMCMAKGMGSGYVPLGAIACSDRVAEAFWGEPEDRVEFAHGQTFGGHTLACAAGLACIEEIERMDLCRQAGEMGDYLRHKLEEMKVDVDVIGDVRGKGLLIGVEFVKDRKTKEHFDGNIRFGKRLEEKMMDRGLLLYCRDNWVSFGPSLIVKKQELNQMIQIFHDSVQEVVSELEQS